LQTRKKYDKSPTFKIDTTSACILRGRNIFWTPRAERTTAGLMPLGIFLFLNTKRAEKLNGKRTTNERETPWRFKYFFSYDFQQKQV